MTNRFNKHDFIENQAKLHFLTTFLTCLNAVLEVFDYAEHDKKTVFEYVDLRQTCKPQYPHRWSYNFYVHFSNPFIFIKSFLEDL